MALTDFTTFEIIRGVVGVADTELPDDVLASDLYEQEVLWALDELNLTLRTQYDTIKTIDPETSRTALQKQLYELIRVYAAYTVAAKLLGGSLKLFAPIQITDAKATQTRIADPFSDLRADVSVSLSVWRTRIASVLSRLDPTQTVTAPVVLTVFSSAPLGFDPVTGA